MRHEYDPETDIMMVHLVDDETARARFGRNFRVPDTGIVLDLAADGTLLAIELMDAARAYGAEAVAAMPVEGMEPIPLAEAAAIAGVGIDALKLACQRGRLEGRKIGRNWTTTRRALHAYLSSRKHAGPGSAAVSEATPAITAASLRTPRRASQSQG